MYNKFEINLTNRLMQQINNNNMLSKIAEKLESNILTDSKRIKSVS